MRTTTSFTAFDHIPEPMRIFMGRRLAEAGAGADDRAFGPRRAQPRPDDMVGAGPEPQPRHGAARVHNWLGAPGAIVADLVMQMFGLASVAILLPARLLGLAPRDRAPPRAAADATASAVSGGGLCATGVAALLPITAHWPAADRGLGGVMGDIVMALPRRLLSGFRPALLGTASFVDWRASARSCCSRASVGLRERVGALETDDDLEEVPRRRAARDEDAFWGCDAEGEPGLGLLSLGACRSMPAMSLRCDARDTSWLKLLAAKGKERARCCSTTRRRRLGAAGRDRGRLRYSASMCSPLAPERPRVRAGDRRPPVVRHAALARAAAHA